MTHHEINFDGLIDPTHNCAYPVALMEGENLLAMPAGQAGVTS